MPSATDRSLAEAAREALARLLPTGVAVRAAPLSSASACAIGASPSQRQREFEAGRNLAAEALASLGSAETMVGVGVRGMPIWPAGYTGSISHTRYLCAVAVGPRGRVRSLGIDIERMADVDPALAPLILRDDEDPQAAPLAWYFSAKEAVFKCQYPVTREDAEFTDARIVWGPGGSFAVEVDQPKFARAGWVRGRAVPRDGLILSAAWLPCDVRSHSLYFAPMRVCDT